jgi:hypothetical protein
MQKLWFLVAALCVAVAASAGAASAFPVAAVTIGASPNPVLNGQKTTISGTVTLGGVPQPSTAVTVSLYSDASCTALMIGVPLTTDGSGNYTEFTSAFGTPPFTIYFQASSLGALSTCLAVTWVATLPGAASPAQDNTFLCYSKFEQDSGMVVPTDLVGQFLQGGFWKPFAIKGTAPSDAYTTAGAYYLACNPPASLKPTGFGVDLGGLDVYDMSVYGNAATVFPIVR